MGLNVGLVGKRYPETTYTVKREAIMSYCAAIDEADSAMAGPRAEVAPPMFAVVYLLENMTQGLFDPELLADADPGRMVHGSQRMDFGEPVRPSDRLRSSVCIEAIEDKGSGQLLKLGFVARNQVDRAVAEVTSAFFFRGPPDPHRPVQPVTPTPIPDALALEEQVPVGLDQAARYAQASGDRNPIHLDPAAARKMGFERPILHGLCTMGLAQRALLAGLAEGQPARLASLQVRFTQVVYPGDRLSLLAWSSGRDGTDQRYAFVLRNQRGEEVIRAGRVSIRPVEQG